MTSRSAVRIAVIGITGAGKTTLISRVTGRDDLLTGDGLESTTSTIQEYEFDCGGTPAILIDTPGFSDTHRTDADVLGDLAAYLAEHTQHDQLIDAVIYMQPITGTRAGGSELNRTAVFQKVLGDEAYKRVIIASTMWDYIADAQEGQRRLDERMRRGDVWGHMTANGAMHVRCEDNARSALNIVRIALGVGHKGLLLLQTEILVQPQLSKTTAGVELYKELQAEVEEHRKLSRQRELAAAESTLWKLGRTVIEAIGVAAANATVVYAKKVLTDE